MKKKKRAKSKTASKAKHTKKLSLFVVIPLILVSLFVIAATTYKIVEIVLTNNSSINFPKLEISLKDAPIEQVDIGTKDIKYFNNTATLTMDGNSTTFENVEIKGRGNYTWTLAKKPYQIKFEDKESPLGLNKGKKWILLANYLDPTSLRTDIVFYLEHLFGEKYPLNGKFVELYIDNVYRGLYYLTEKVEIGENRINLKSSSDILVELDNLYGATNGCYYDKDGDCLVIKESVNKDDEENNMQEFLKTFNSLKSAIRHQDYEKIVDSVDVDSFAKYFLLSEFVVNPDAYSTSFFMYKNELDNKIYAGPGWDFDLALGNKNWTHYGIDQENFLSPFETTALKNYLDKPEEVPFAKSISSILYDLMNIPEFEERVKEIYQETLSGKDEELLEYIKSQAEYIRSAVSRDQERWKIRNNFDEEVDYLVDWVAKRYDHFEEVYGN